MRSRSRVPPARPDRGSPESRSDQGALERNVRGRRPGRQDGLLEQGLEWKPLDLKSLHDLQLVEAARLASVEVARLFLVPPSMIGHSDTVNRSTAQIDFETLYRCCLYPATTLVADQISRGLHGAAERLAGWGVDVATDDWLRGAGSSFAEMASKLVGAGVTPDEIRSFLKLPPLPNGPGPGCRSTCPSPMLLLPHRPRRRSRRPSPPAAAALPCHESATSSPSPRPRPVETLHPAMQLCSRLRKWRTSCRQARPERRANVSRREFEKRMVEIENRTDPGGSGGGAGGECLADELERLIEGGSLEEIKTALGQAS